MKLVDAVRVDKFLWSVRLFKTRSLAAEACKNNRVLINESAVKPSREIKVNEIFELKKNPIIYKYRVKELLSNRVGAKLVENYIENIIEQYSYYKVIITDRYHGTIFSLAANTPVIIIKTSDHKVVTGADWFKGVYDGYVYVAESLDDAYAKASEILRKDFSYNLLPYFKANYYDKLKGLATETFRK